MDAVQRWMHDHPEEMQGITLRWEPETEPDDAAFHRLLHLLFDPRPGDDATAA